MTTKIVLLENPCEVPDEFRDEDGTLSFCVPDSIAVRLNIKNEEISDLEKLTSDYSNSFEMFITKSTHQILQFASFDRVAKDTRRYRAILTIDTVKKIDGFLLVSETKEHPIKGNTKVKFQLVGTHQTWKDEARLLNICNIDLGSFLWTEANILDLWENNATYADDLNAVYPLLASFGKFPDPSDIKVSDLRVVVFLRALIFQGFCKLGYEVRSAFMNTTYFRKLGLYLLKPDFYNYSNKGSKIRFRAELTADQLIDTVSILDPLDKSEIILFDDDFTAPNEDPGLNYDPVTGIFENNQTGTFTLKFSFTVRVCNTDSTNFGFNIRLIGEDAGGGSLGVLNWIAANVDPGGCDEFTLTFGEIEVPPGYKFWVEFLSFGFNDGISTFPAPVYTVKAGSFFRAFSCAKSFEDGDTITTKDSIRCDIDFYKLLLDCRKIFNLRFRTIESEKVIEIEPAPSSYTLFDGTRIKGFEASFEDSENIIDITSKVDLCEFIEKDLKQQETPIEYFFKFLKDENEKFNGSGLNGSTGFLSFAEEDPAFSKRVEIATGTKNIKTIDLKVFAPTLNDFSTEIANLPGEEPFIPFMWNEERVGSDLPEVGFNYEPRILFIVGLTKQRTQENSILFARYTFEGVLQDEIPTVAQFYPYWIEDQFLNQVQVFDNIAFGLGGIFEQFERNKDIVTTFHKSGINNEVNSIRHRIKAFLTCLDLTCYNPRKIFKIAFEVGGVQKFNGYYIAESISKDINKASLANMKLLLKVQVEDCPLDPEFF